MQIQKMPRIQPIFYTGPAGALLVFNLKQTLKSLFIRRRNFKGLVIPQSKVYNNRLFPAHSMEMANPSGLDGGLRGKDDFQQTWSPAVCTCPISQPDHSLGRKMAEIKEKFYKAERFGLFSHLLVESRKPEEPFTSPCSHPDRHQLAPLQWLREKL
ncbi:hypothetical protein MJT46_011784 [Ovis ammon polii x Ovis aries]|nr:hypothetical protein MJT46_011784 [Ovis ammon polii x Ovis aries]